MTVESSGHCAVLNVLCRSEEGQKSLKRRACPLSRHLRCPSALAALLKREDNGGQADGGGSHSALR